MAARLLLRVGAAAARSSTGYRYPAGQVPLSLSAPALRRPGFGIPAPQARYLSDRVTKLENDVHELKEKLAVSEKLAELAERRAKLAEQRAEMAEERMRRVEGILSLLQARIDYLFRFTSDQFAFVMRLHGEILKQLQTIFMINALSYWKLSQKFVMMSNRTAEIIFGFRKEVLMAQNSVSAASWKVVMVLLGAFGAITMFYLPYVINDTKADIMKEVVNTFKELIHPVQEEVSQVKKDQQKSRWLPF